jgi:hypothetical protein
MGTVPHVETVFRLSYSSSFPYNELPHVIKATLPIAIKTDFIQERRPLFSDLSSQHFMNAS